jgi:2-polyprenyl-3-methyl-5-hydroxy-6-metoxy-1,4-benzoquinol methylase
MRLSSLEARSEMPEQMDDAALDLATYAAVLRDLSLVNRLTLAARPTLSFLEKATRSRSHFRLLDVGFGSGDMLRAVCKWARRRGIDAQLVGVDRDDRSLPVAIAATPVSMGIKLVTGDYEDVPGPFDFVISSLVTHHMTEAEIIRFVRFMEQRARGGWLINDLHRQSLAVMLFGLLASAAGVHPIVRSDGMLSIARSFRQEDWEGLLCRAGLTEGEARILSYFPFRLCVERLS